MKTNIKNNKSNKRISNKQFIKNVHFELENLGFKIPIYGDCYDSKFSLYKNYEISNNSQYLKPNYVSICEFVVGKKYNKEYYTVWDYRENQPFMKNIYCTYEGVFGRYDFTNKSDFLNHIQSDYVITEYELLLENKRKMNITPKSK